MTPPRDRPGRPGGDDDRPPCSVPDCDVDAAFYLYGRDPDGWRPRCDRHVRHAHPSLELKSWMESGYLKPVELGEPTGPPADPVTDRMAAFREAVDETLGWDRLE